MREHAASPPEASPGAPSLVERARRALLAWVDEAGEGGCRLLQVWIRRTRAGGYELRHASDVAQPLAWLTCHRDPQAALEIARTTDAGGHRPLRTTPDLRRGWALVELDGFAVWTALSRFYPGAAVHWYLQRTGELQVTPWPATAARQSGLYARVGALQGAPLEAAVRACCDGGMCLRSRAWSTDAGGALGPPLPEEAERSAVIPCREACTLFVSFAREALRVETELPEVAERVPSRSARKGLAEGLRDIATRVAREPAAVGTADFAHRMNPRRLRYWAERLESEVEEGAPPEQATGTGARGAGARGAVDPYRPERGGSRVGA